jgi:hypothetical protein
MQAAGAGAVHLQGFGSPRKQASLVLLHYVGFVDTFNEGQGYVELKRSLQIRKGDNRMLFLRCWGLMLFLFLATVTVTVTVTGYLF